MNNSLLSLLLLVLIVMAAVNAFLTLRLASLIRSGTWPPPRQTGLPAGVEAPKFMARRLIDDSRFSSADLEGAPAVLVFLGAGCPKCAEVKPRLIELLPAMDREGVRLVVVSMEARVNPSDPLAHEPLRGRVLLARAKARGQLNPGNLTPYYVFVDHEGRVAASGLVGEPDWLSFVQQMDESAPSTSRMQRDSSTT